MVLSADGPPETDSTITPEALSALTLVASERMISNAVSRAPRRKTRSPLKTRPQFVLPSSLRSGIPLAAPTSTRQPLRAAPAERIPASQSATDLKGRRGGMRLPNLSASDSFRTAVHRQVEPSIEGMRIFWSRLPELDR